jgi:hypothetical protein
MAEANSGFVSPESKFKRVEVVWEEKGNNFFGAR